MSSSDRFDPPSFSGSFAELESDLPVGVTLAQWREGRPRGLSGRSGLAAGRAPQGRTLWGAVVGATAAQRARPRPEEDPVSYLHSSELRAGGLGTRRERRATLFRLGRQGRLAAYRRGELDFESCCLWAARWPHEVPLLQGEFEFIARTMPEVCE